MTTDISANSIEDAFEKELIAAMPFGRFWINERIASEYYGVSRTIIRELLFKFQQRMLVSKDERSHWIVGPLTSTILQQQYDTRYALEPVALREYSKSMNQQYIMHLLDVLENSLNTEKLTPEQIRKVEFEFHYGLYQNNANKLLLETLRQAQTPLLINQMFFEIIGTKDATQALNEHTVILRLLRWGALDAACETLRFHIESAANRMHQRLKAFSVFPRPEHPPFLKSV